MELKQQETMTISFSGLASGLDTSSWITSLTALKQAKVTTLQEKRENILVSKNALSSIKSFFASFRSTLERITDSRFNIVSMNLFAQNIATSAKMNVVSATATSEAKEGKYEVKVDKLASNTQAVSKNNYRTTIVETTTATGKSLLKDIGIKAGEVLINVNGEEKSLVITNSDTLSSLVTKLKNIGVDANYNDKTGVFSANISADDIDDVGNTDIVTALRLGSVNKGYQSSDLTYDKVETIYGAATGETRLDALGVNSGTITINSNGYQYELALETEDRVENGETVKGDTIQDLIDVLASANITASIENGVFRIEDAVIVDDGDTGLLDAFGFNTDVSNTTQQSGNLTYQSVLSSTTDVSLDTKLTELSTNIEANIGDTVFVQDNNGEETEIVLTENMTLGQLLQAMNDAGLNAVLGNDGKVSITNGIITGGTYDATRALGLAYEIVEGIVTGLPLTETVELDELAALDSKLVGDLGVKEGYLEVTDSAGTAHYLKITSDDTISSFITTLTNMGLGASYDSATGVLTLSGGDYRSLTDSEVQDLVDGGVILESNPDHIKGTDLLSALFGATEIPALSTSIGSSSSNSDTLLITNTLTHTATLETTLESLGLQEGDTIAKFEVNGEEKNVTFNSDMTIDDMLTVLNGNGINATYDELTGVLNIDGAEFVTAGTSLTEALVYQTLEYNATEDTTFGQLEHTGEIFVYDDNDNLVGTVTASETKTIGEVLGELSAYGVNGSISNGVIVFEQTSDAYIGGDLAEELGFTNSFETLTTTRTQIVQQSTGQVYDGFGSLITGDTAIGVAGQVTLHNPETDAIVRIFSYSESTTYDQLCQQLARNGIYGGVHDGIFKVESSNNCAISESVIGTVSISTTTTTLEVAQSSSLITTSYSEPLTYNYTQTVFATGSTKLVDLITLTPTATTGTYTITGTINSDGSVTGGNVVAINNADELGYIALGASANNNWEGYTFVLTDDIEYTGTDLGTFSGTFDAIGHSIEHSNLYLFKEIYGTVKNLSVSGTYTSTADYCGGGAIAQILYGNIEYCTSSFVYDLAECEDAAIGGVVGKIADGATIKYTEFTGTITTAASLYGIGGIAAMQAGNSEISYCANLGTITGGTFIGGIVGESEGTLTLSNCHFAGSIFTTDTMATTSGFVSYNSGVINIDHSYIEPGNSFTAAWVGDNAGTVYASYMLMNSAILVSGSGEFNTTNCGKVNIPWGNLFDLFGYDSSWACCNGNYFAKTSHLNGVGVPSLNPDNVITLYKLGENDWIEYKTLTVGELTTLDDLANLDSGIGFSSDGYIVLRNNIKLEGNIIDQLGIVSTETITSTIKLSALSCSDVGANVVEQKRIALGSSIAVANTKSITTINGTIQADGSISGGTIVGIGTKEELDAMFTYCEAGNTYSGIHFILTSDIDLGTVTYQKGLSLTGSVFDGHGHTISGDITIESATSSYGIGVFSYIRNNSVVENLEFKGTLSTTATDGVAFGFVGFADNSKILNLRLEETLSFNNTGANASFVGGVLGGGISVIMDNVELKNSNINLTLAKKTTYAGGFVGSLNGGALTNLYYNGGSFNYDTSAGGSAVSGAIAGNLAGSALANRIVIKSASIEHSTTGTSRFLVGQGSAILDNVWADTTTATSSLYGGTMTTSNVYNNSTALSDISSNIANSGQYSWYTNAKGDLCLAAPGSAIMNAYDINTGMLVGDYIIPVGINYGVLSAACGQATGGQYNVGNRTIDSDGTIYFPNSCSSIYTFKCGAFEHLGIEVIKSDSVVIENYNTESNQQILDVNELTTYITGTTSWAEINEFTSFSGDSIKIINASGEVVDTFDTTGKTVNDVVCFARQYGIQLNYSSGILSSRSTTGYQIGVNSDLDSLGTKTTNTTTVTNTDATMSSSKILTYETVQSELTNTGIAGESNLSEVLGLQVTIGGKYTESDALYAQTSITTSSSYALGNSLTMSDDTLLTDLGITSGDLILNQGQNTTTLTLDTSVVQTVGDFRALLEANGFETAIDSQGRLNIWGAQDWNIVDDTSNAMSVFGTNNWTADSLVNEVTVWANEDTKLSELGLIGKSFAIYNEADNLLISNAYVTRDQTLGEFFDYISGYGITASIENGYITMTSAEGCYITGTLPDALGVGKVYSTNIGSSIAVTYTQVENATATTKLVDINALEGVLSSGSGELEIYNSNGTIKNIITINSEMTLDNLISELSAKGVKSTYADGKLSIKTKNGEYLYGDVADALGLAAERTTALRGLTSTTQVKYTQTVVIGATTLQSNANMVNMTDTSGLTALSAVADMQFQSGQTYAISTTADLQALAEIVNGGNSCSGVTFVMTDDIDLSSIENWTPIGNTSNDFEGTFDGNGYEITGLNIDSTSSYQGLFGCIRNATIKNLGITGYEISGDAYVGALAGAAYYSTITNVYTEGTISATGSEVGGLVGSFSNGIITSCQASGTIESTSDFVGGLVGDCSATIVSSSSDANVTGSYYVGGIAGYGHNNGRYISVYSSGTITATDSTKANTAGGIVGLAGGNTTIQNSYAKATVSDGGGAIAGSISSSYTLAIINSRALSNNYVAYANANTTTTGCSVITADETPFIINAQNSVQASVSATTLSSISDYVIKSGHTYKISTTADLQALANIVNRGNTCAGTTFVLENNIDLSSIENWTAIGNSSNSFSGTFDGNGYKITGLNIDSSSDYQGLFGYIQNATIKNLGITGYEISGSSYVGALAGSASYSTITNVYTEGTISATGSYVGGLVGYLYSGTITSCQASGTIESTSYSVGGLVGSGSNCTITCSSSEANVTGTYNVGGIIGYGYGKYTSVYSSGTITATISSYPNRAGGIVGLADGNTTIQDSYTKATVSDGGGAIAGSVSSSYTLAITNSQALSNNYVAYANAKTTTTNCSVLSANETPFTINPKFKQYCTLNDTLADYGLASGNYYVTISNAGTLYTMTIKQTDTMQSVKSQFELLGMTFSVEALAGKADSVNRITLSGDSDTYIVDELDDSLDAVFKFADVETIQYQTVNRTLTGATTMGDLGITSGTLTIKNTAGEVVYTHTYDSSMTVDEYNLLLKAHGNITASISNGKMSLTHGGDCYAVDESLYFLGIKEQAWYIKSSNATNIGTSSAPVYAGLGAIKVTVGVTQTSTARLVSTMATDTLTALSAVTASDMVSGATFKIATSDDLLNLATIVNGGTNCSGVTFVMANDIDLSSIENWTPIGDGSNSFQGTFDGNGYEITGMNIDSTSDYQGLFGSISYATIKNLGITGYEISGGGTVGALAGDAQYSTITNVYTDGTISETGLDVGGLVGYLYSGTITSCQASGTIESTSNYVGGLVGYGLNCTITCSSSEANVVGTGGVGGIAGAGSGIYTSVYSSGTITVTDSIYAETAGGIVGLATTLTIKNSYTKATVSDGGGAIAGLVSSALAIINTQALSNNYVASPNANTTTTNCSVLSANETPFTLEAKCYVTDMNTKLSNLGLGSTCYMTVVSDGTLYTFSIATTDTIGSFASLLSQRGLATTFSDGKLTISGWDNCYIKGELDDRLDKVFKFEDLASNSEVYERDYSVTTLGIAQTSSKVIKSINSDTSTLRALSSIALPGQRIDPGAAGTYSISTSEELLTLQAAVNLYGSTFEGFTFVLANDIDLSTFENWTPIGGCSATINGTRTTTAFSGTLDGNGYEIKGLRIGRYPSGFVSYCTGLFGKIENATIKNLSVIDYDIYAYGPIAGTAINSTIINVHTEGKLTGGSGGGIVGCGENIYLRQCSTSGSLYIGGGGYYGGGLIGSVKGSGTLIESCYSDMEIGAVGYTGGLVGAIEGGTIRASFFKGKVLNSYGSTLNITDTMGGLVGYVTASLTISSCGVDAEQALGGGLFIGTVMGNGVRASGCVVRDNGVTPFVKRGSVTGTIGTLSDTTTVPTFFYKNPVCDASTKLGSLGITGTEYITYISKGTQYICTIDANTTINELAEKLAPLGAKYENGKFTIAGGENSYIRGELDSDLAYALNFDSSNPLSRVVGVDSIVSTIGITQTSSKKLQLRINTDSMTALSEVADMQIQSGQTYAISTTADLQALAELVNSGNSCSGATFVMTNNIDLSSIENWTAIGNSSNYFQGIFDGNGYEITGLNIDSTSDYQGLFGYISNATIKNLGITSYEISGRNDVGALAGYAYYSTITNVYTEGTISATGSYVAGLVGYLYYGTITSCQASGTIESTSYFVGGLVGYGIGTIVSSSSEANVVGTYNVGGIAGLGRGKYTSVYSSGTITATNSTKANTAGGIVGYISSHTTIQDSYTKATVSDGGGSIAGSVSSSYTFAITNSQALSNNYVAYANANTTTTNCSVLSAGETPFIINAQNSVQASVSATTLSSILDYQIKSGQTYKISTTAELQALAEIVNGGNKCIGATFVLENDIDLSSIENWTAIGNISNSFQGIFDGNGYEITDMNIDSTSGNQGLFGYIYNATIKNLGITGYEISGRDYVGALAGQASSSTITNVYTEGTISATGSIVGGLVGYLVSGTITSCQASGTIESTSNSVGGLAGYGNGTIVSSSSDANVKGSYNVGGIAGSGCGKYTSVYSSGTITAIDSTSANIAGGIVGHITYNITIQNSYTKATVSDGGGAIAGSVVSSYTLAITNSQALSDNYVAYANANTTITNCSTISADDTPFTIERYKVQNYDTFSELGFIGTAYVTTVSNGTEEVFTINTNTTIGGFVNYLNSRGFEASLEDGKFSISGSKDRYIKGDLDDRIDKALNLEDVNFSAEVVDNSYTVTTVNPILTSSAVLVTTSNTSTLTALSEVTASDMVSGRTYKISTTDELLQLASIVNSGISCSGVTFILANDIDLSTTGIWTPIGNSSNPFQGTFDGNGYEIKRMKVGRPAQFHQGLFGYIRNATIKNLGITGCNVNGGVYVGALAGQAEYSTITNVYTEGTISATHSYVGGLVGYLNFGRITSCQASGTIESTSDSVGGLVGYGSGTIVSSSSEANVVGTYNVGGIAGSGGGKYISVYSLGTITATDSTKANTAGGIVGSINSDTTIQDSYTKATVSSGGGDLVGNRKSKNLFIINSQALSDNYCASGGAVINNCSIITTSDTPFTISAKRLITELSKLADLGLTGNIAITTESGSQINLHSSMKVADVLGILRSQLGSYTKFEDGKVTIVYNKSAEALLNSELPDELDKIFRLPDINVGPIVAKDVNENTTLDELAIAKGYENFNDFLEETGATTDSVLFSIDTIKGKGPTHAHAFFDDGIGSMKVSAFINSITSDNVNMTIENGKFVLTSDDEITLVDEYEFFSTLFNITEVGQEFNPENSLVDDIGYSISYSTTLGQLGLTSDATITGKKADGTVVTLTFDSEDSLGDICDALRAEIGVNSAGVRGNGILTVYSNNGAHLISVSENLSDVLHIEDDVMDVVNDDSNMITVNKSVVFEAVPTYGVVDKNTTLGEITDINGNNLGITDGKIYSNKNGVHRTIEVKTTDTLEQFATKLAQAGMKLVINNDGSMKIKGSGNAFLTTAGLDEAEKSNILEKLDLLSWQDYESTKSSPLVIKTDSDGLIDGDEKLVELKNAEGNSLGITEGTFTIVSNGVKFTESITANTTINDFLIKLSQKGIQANISSEGVISISGQNNTYLLHSSGAVGESNVVDILFPDWQNINVYRTSPLKKQTNETEKIDENTKLADINQGTYIDGNITVTKNGVDTYITLNADETVGTFMQKLRDEGFEVSINNNGQIVIKNPNNATLKNYDGPNKASNILDIIGVDENSFETTSNYVGSVLHEVSKSDQEVSATRDTLLSDLQITQGEYYIWSNGVRTIANISANETIGSFLDTLRSFGIQASLRTEGENTYIKITGNGESYVETSNAPSGVSNVVDKLFLAGVLQDFNYDSKKLEANTEVTSTIVADYNVKLSDFDQEGSTANGLLKLIVGGTEHVIDIGPNDTFGDLITKLDKIGVAATIQNGKLYLDAFDKDIFINTAASTSGIVNNFGLVYNDDLGITASNDNVEQTTKTETYVDGSVAEFADLSTSLSMLNISSGTLSIYRDGEKASISVNSNDTFEVLKQKIQDKFADVELRFDAGYLELYSTSDNVKVEVGATTDTSNLIAITGLANRGADFARSSRELYKVNGDSKITAEGLFKLGNVNEGTFIVGDATFTIDENTTLNNIISQINSSAGANATAYWDSVEGKFVIKSRVSGATFINIEAGTSNFTDIMGFTISTRDGGGNLTSTMLNIDSQEIGGNAEFSINGTDYTSVSNVVGSDVTKIEGLTFNLKDVSNGQTVTVLVEKDYDSISDAMQEVVDAYNDLIENVDEEISMSGDLKGESTLKLLRNQIRSLMMGNIAGATAYNNLHSVGISTEAASGANISTATINKLKFDRDKFIEAFRADSEAVEYLLVGDNIQSGILSKVENVIESAVASASGYFSSAEKSYANQIDRLDKQIERANAAVASYKSRLEQKFQYMDMMISKMQEQFSTFLGT